MRTHRDLNAWKMSMDLAEEIYALTSPFPASEKFGLASQLRKAAISVPSNIAEGASRASKKEFNHFLHIALGSTSELETQLNLAKRIGYLTDEGKVLSSVEEVRRPLMGLIKFLKERTNDC